MRLRRVGGIAIGELGKVGFDRFSIAHLGKMSRYIVAHGGKLLDSAAEPLVNAEQVALEGGKENRSACGRVFEHQLCETSVELFHSGPAFGNLRSEGVHIALRRRIDSFFVRRRSVVGRPVGRLRPVSRSIDVSLVQRGVAADGDGHAGSKLGRHRHPRKPAEGRVPTLLKVENRRFEIRSHRVHPARGVGRRKAGPVGGLSESDRSGNRKNRDG